MSDPVLARAPLGFQWPTLDPFLFCVHHDDRYPPGNGRFGPTGSLAGRSLGQDFELKDGFRMYHGLEVPGFPQHPHRGFETITLARRGFIDHADSLGAAARFGEGDVQWLTTGSGIVHAEMFPLLDERQGNRVELFQIWLNLPAARKLSPPHFSMFWHEQIPTVTVTDAAGRRTHVTVIAGAWEGTAPLAPPPDSAASDAERAIAVWLLRLEPGAEVTVPAAAVPRAGAVARMLYAFEGDALSVGGHAIEGHHALHVRADGPTQLRAGEQAAEVLVLQGRPLAEPVAQWGPFVMNQRHELEAAVRDYQRTQFGGWPWPSDGPVHGHAARFARYPDGRREEPAPATAR